MLNKIFLKVQGKDEERLEEQSDLDCLQKYPLPLLPTISVLILLCASGSGHPYVCAQSTLILQRKSAEHLQLCVVCVCVNTQPVISTWVARWTNLKNNLFFTKFWRGKTKTKHFMNISSNPRTVNTFNSERREGN